MYKAIPIDFVQIKKDEIFAAIPICDFANLELQNKYQQYYHKENYIFLSFLVYQDKELMAIILANKIIDQLTHHEHGVEIIYKNPPAVDLLEYIIEHLLDLANIHDCKQIRIWDNFSDNCDDLKKAFLKNQYIEKNVSRMLIDFENFNIEGYYSKVRKSYKSLINWGRTNLDIKNINKNNLIREDFINFKEFHKNVSGRVTRSDESWDTQFEMLANDYGELMLGYLDGKLVAGTLVLENNKTSLYGVGVYDRSLFNFGISHYMVYDAVIRSYERGKSSNFDFGLLDDNVQDSKIKNIQFFKKGFVPELTNCSIVIKNLRG